jgi:hypothetical protein
MAGNSIFCAGNVTTSSVGAAQCVDGSGGALAWTLVPDFDIAQLDTPTMGGAFSAGFVMVGMGWVLGKLFGSVIDFLK